MLKLGLFFILIFNLLLVTSCGRSPTTENSNDSPAEEKTYIPLSEEQAQKLITPTVYYIPQYQNANMVCEPSDLRDIKDKKGKVLVSVCAAFLKNCMLQGTCKVSVDNKLTLIHYSHIVEGEYRFSIVDEKICRFGYGTKRICMDPYYSVAADLSIYKAGTVIYVPDLVGLLMPDDTIHNGYFIVRDSGSAIKGFGRFDFFTGYFGLNKSLNTLYRVGLGWKGTHLPFFVVTGEEAVEILKLRNYPSLPELK